MDEIVRPVRIIPARAGFTTAPGCPSRPARDHPRSGFTCSILPTHPHAYGSSPLARGLLSHPMTAPRRVRIIPARAGFTQGVYEAVLRARDHPRSRGVYEAAPSRVSVRVGSSPLARGLPGWMWSARLRVRIIPARAGFTPPSSSTWPMRGSSPLARGLPIPPSHLGPARGIIPARAGFTRHPARDAEPPRDHPRSRGVYGRRWSMWCGP